MIRGDLKFFRNIRGEKAMRGNLDFKGGLKTLEETMPIPLIGLSPGSNVKSVVFMISTSKSSKIPCA